MAFDSALPMITVVPVCVEPTGSAAVVRSPIWTLDPLEGVTPWVSETCQLLAAMEDGYRILRTPVRYEACFAYRYNNQLLSSVEKCWVLHRPVYGIKYTAFKTIKFHG